MSESPKPKMSEQDAEELANAIASKTSVIFRGWAKPVPEEKVTVAELIRLGAMFYAISNESFRDQSLKDHNRQFLSKIIESLHTPAALQVFLYEQFMEHGRAGADEVQQAIAEVKKLAISPKIIRDALNEIVPKAPPGKPTQCRSREDQEDFLAEARALTTTCSLFIDTHRRLTKTTPEEVLRFLESEDPQHIPILLDSVPFIKETLGCSAFKRLKGAGTRARNLALGVSGNRRFGWSYVYALQRAGEFLRSKRG
jgi:predicted house-cleaning noncanonical NTP pyrophosphatase (MazG superfamily)